MQEIRKMEEKIAMIILFIFSVFIRWFDPEIYAKVLIIGLFL